MTAINKDTNEVIIEESIINNEFELDTSDEMDGLESILELQFDQQGKLKEIFDSIVDSSAKNNNKTQLGYLIKMSEQLTGNANTIGGLLKARGSLKKDVVDQRIKIKKAAIDEDLGNQALELNSDLIKLIHQSISNNSNMRQVVPEEPKLVENMQKEIDDIDNQIEKQLSNNNNNTDNIILEENENIISDTDGYMYIYNSETGDIQSLMDTSDDTIPMKAEEVVFDEDKQEYVALFNDTYYEVFEIE